MKFSRLIISAVTALLLVGPVSPIFPTVVSASENTRTVSNANNIPSAQERLASSFDQMTSDLSSKEVSDELEQLTPYVFVRDNQYSLDPAVESLYPALYDKALNAMSQSNALVRSEGLRINPDTLVAKTPETRSAGKNGYKVHWNFIRIYISAGALNNLGLAGLTGITIAGIWISRAKISKIVNTFGAIGSLTWQILVNGKIKSGIYFDVNFFILGLAAGTVVAGLPGIGAALFVNAINNFGRQ